MATQSFVSQVNFAGETEMAVRSGAVVPGGGTGTSTADFTRGIQVTAAGHANSTSGVQIQQTTAQQSIQHPQQVLHTITPDNFTSNNSVKNEGILICYS